jgi:hypothetical protein
MGATVCFFSAKARVTKTFKIAGAAPLYCAGGVERYTSGRDGQISSVQPSQDMARIHALEAELFQYRYMVEKMVRQRTMQLARRIAILKSCNARVCDEFGKLRDKYLGLLNAVQANEHKSSLPALKTTVLFGHPVNNHLVAVYRPRPLLESLPRQLNTQSARCSLNQSEHGMNEFGVNPVAKWSVTLQTVKKIA